MAEHYVFNRMDGVFVKSVSEPTPVDPPEWARGDVKSITVTFVDPLPRGRVSVVTSIVGAQLGLGTPGGTVLTSATAGTVDASFAYPFTVSLNLAAIGTFLGSELRKSTTIEFRVSDSTGPNRYHGTVILLQQLLSDTVADPAPPEVALTRNEAAGIYTPKEWPAGMRQIMTTDSGRRFLVYPHDDGRFQFDEI